MNNLVGQKFNRLTVLYREGKTSPIQWHCKCDCGNEVNVRAGNLTSGNTKSCGCLQKEKTRNMGQANKRDLTNQKFGFLTVLSPTEERSGHNIKWKCQCDCGNITIVAGGDLTKGSTKSCGCQRYNKDMLVKDMIGKVFGKLTVLEKAGHDSDGSFNYLCQCECGNQKIVNGVSLRQGVTSSCGCITSSIGENNIKQILQTNNISYVKEYTVTELNNKRFDFAIIVDNQISRLIEFDGRQHFEATNSLWENTCPLKERQRRDQEKNQWAHEHSIPLVRIPYWERDHITLDMILGDQYLVKPE